MDARESVCAFEIKSNQINVRASLVSVTKRPPSLSLHPLLRFSFRRYFYNVVIYVAHSNQTGALTHTHNIFVDVFVYDI